MEPVRRCSHCGEYKPTDAFIREKRFKVGFTARCRACANEYNRLYRQRPDVKVRDRLRMRERIAKNREAYRERDRKRYREGRCPPKVLVPEKERARRAVWNAQRYGRITKPKECSRCGHPTPRVRLHAHHPDYSKPLEIIWLCSECHGLEHQIPT